MKDKTRDYFTLIWCYAFSFILIVTTGGAWYCDDSLPLTDGVLWKLMFFILIVGLIFFLLIGNRLCITDDLKIKLAIVFLCMISYIFVSQEDTSYYCSHFFVILLWMIICLLFQEDKCCVWKAYVNIVFILAIVSLFFYLFGTILRVIPETGTTSIDWGIWDTSAVRSFYNIYYEAQSMKISESTRIMRNCGFFSEAPMYNFVLCTALGIELFLQKHSNKWKCLIIIITIITTMSTTGFLFLIIAGILYYIEYAYRQKIIFAHKKTFCIVIIMGVMLMMGILWAKLITPSGVGSTNVRTDHLLACIKTWLEYTMYGCGYLNENSVLNFALYKQGISVGLPYLLACGGIILSLVLLFPYMVNMIKAIKNRSFKEICFETLFLILYFFTAITGRPLFLFFIAYITVYQYEEMSI